MEPAQPGSAYVSAEEAPAEDFGVPGPVLSGSGEPPGLPRPAQLVQRPNFAREGSVLAQQLDFDPTVVSSALQAGVPVDQLKTIGRLVKQRPTRLEDLPRKAPGRADPLSGSEHGEGDPDPMALMDPGMDPVASAVCQLTKIVGSLTRTQKKEPTLEDALNGVSAGSSGSADQSISFSSRRNAAALRALKKALLTAPKAIWQSIEELMEEDYHLRASAPGLGQPQMTARAWAQYRSRIQNYPQSVRWAWGTAGALDALRMGNVDECRARLCLMLGGTGRPAVDRQRKLAIVPGNRPGTSSSLCHISDTQPPRPDGAAVQQIAGSEMGGCFCCFDQGDGRLCGAKEKAWLKIFSERRGGAAKQSRSEAQRERKTWKRKEQRRKQGKRAGNCSPSCRVIDGLQAGGVTGSLPGSSLSAQGFLAEPTVKIGRELDMPPACETSVAERGHDEFKPLLSELSPDCMHDSFLQEPGDFERSPQASLFAAVVNDAAEVSEALGNHHSTAVEGPKVADQVRPKDVPGSKASTTFLSSFWHSLPRLSLKKSRSFGFFFTSLLQKPVGQWTSCPTADVWPMPLPFPNVFKKGFSSHPEDPLKKAVCLQIGYLNWLFLGNVRSSPDWIRLGVELNDKQWDVTNRFLRLSTAWTHFSVVAPADMGRGAAKHEALEEVLSSLEEIAANNSAQHRGYVHGSKGMVFDEHLRMPRGVGQQHTGNDEYKSVGRLRVNNLEVAQPIFADRIKMTGEPRFDPRAFLDPQGKALYEDPIRFAVEPWDVDQPLPTVKVHATYKEKFKLFSKLDDTNRLAIARVDEVREFAANGLFTVIKDLEYDRLILDGRRPNQLQKPLNRWILSMASASNLIDIPLGRDETLIMTGHDLVDYYYAFIVDKPRACRNFLAGCLTGREAKQFRCCPEGVGDDERVYACLKSLAMGDCSACEFAQTSHIALGLRSRAFKLKHLLTLRGRVPREPFMAGIIIDDMIFLERVLTDLVTPQMSDSAKQRIASMEQQYRTVGLQTHPKKGFRDSVDASFWGAHIDGVAGLVRANPQRVIPMMAIVSRVVQLGYASISLLETIAGVFISVFSFRRRLFSLLSEIYKLPSALDQKDVVPLSEVLIDELLGCMILAPLAVADLKAEFSSTLYMCDASDWGEAVVSTEIGKTMSQELLRHCLNKPSWTRLLSPFKAWLRMRDELDPSMELPNSDEFFTEHPLWETAARAFDFELVKKRRARGGRHINIGELQSYLMAERAAGYKQTDSRVPISGDSQVTLGAVNKGRSSSPALNKELQRSLPFCLGLGIYSFSGYTRTAFNPADDPTRGVPIRQSDVEVPSWWLAGKDGNFAPLDAFLEGLNMLPEQISGLPPESELFPDSLPFDGSDFDKSKTQRFKFKIKEKLHARHKAAEEQVPYSTALPWDLATHEVLMSFPKTRFLLRDESCWPPREPGFIDLFSGRKGFARAAVAAGAPWVLTFEIADGADQDLTNSAVKRSVEQLLRGGAASHLSAAPTCASFSMAVTPAVRSKKHPMGIPGLKWSRPKMWRKVVEGNGFNSWLAHLIEICLHAGIIFWVENPDGSYFWRQPKFQLLVSRNNLGFYRCDFCVFGTRWRKRARFCANNGLQHTKHFCRGDHSHVVLRGRSSYHKCSWTKVAEPYPRGLCSKLAWASAYTLELLPRHVHRRIGEAKNPGPKQKTKGPRAGEDLEAVELIRPATLKLGNDQWQLFLDWLKEEVGKSCVSSVLSVPGLLALSMRSYGKLLYEKGKPLYLLRHLVVHCQRLMPAFRQHSKPVWDLISRWEAVEPIQHRPPLPVTLLHAMLGLALSWGWFRWSAVTMLAFFGACRPGEVLRAERQDLVLPSDMFLEDNICFLQIRRPKSAARGIGSVQHTKISDAQTISFCRVIFEGLDATDRLYPSTSSTYRKRWDVLLQTLGIPLELRFTPGSLRGGGAVHKYRSGAAITDVMWSLRLKRVETLQHYLQEATASLSLAFLLLGSKLNVQSLAAYFPFLLVFLLQSRRPH
eukprot:Skav222409  [mRNA]  locus=scaffold4005:148863:154871:+ [translate_table: standard]